jgi:hypothetical protein
MKIQIGTEIRDMTPDEVVEYNAAINDQQNTIAKIKAIEAARTSAKAKLAALGLTEDEINALIGGV